jgi:ABC-type transport system substrate-binding protein
VATTAAQPVTASIKRGGVLKAQRQNDWPTHDPHLTQTNSQDMPLVFDYLTRIDRNATTGNFDIGPSLAESWELPDPKTVVFKLRAGVKFHDGTDCDAAAVKWNLERLMTHPQSAGKNHTASIASVEATDAATLRLNLKTPSPVLFVNLSSEADSVAGIMSPTHAQKVGDTGLAQQPVGTGPFQMAEFARAARRCTVAIRRTGRKRPTGPRCRLSTRSTSSSNRTRVLLYSSCGRVTLASSRRLPGAMWRPSKATRR